jgi:predicted DNA-binding transcriptional regulator AlpA
MISKHKSSANPDEAYFTDIELAHRFKVSRQTIWRWAEAGCLPKPVKLSMRTRRWRASDIQKFERRQNP